MVGGQGLKMVDVNNYFNFYDIFVNELIGNIWLAFFVGLIIIYIGSVRANMPQEITIMFSVLWAAIMFSVATSTLLIVWILLGIFVSGLVYYRYSRTLRRG